MSTTFASNISSNGAAEAQSSSDRALEHHKGERSSLPPVPVRMTSPDWSFRQDLTRGGSAVLSEDHILSGEHTGLAKNVCECVCHHPCVSIWGMRNWLAYLGREKAVKICCLHFFRGKRNFLRTRSHFWVHFTVQIKRNCINGQKISIHNGFSTREEGRILQEQHMDFFFQWCRFASSVCNDGNGYSFNKNIEKVSSEMAL